MNQIQETKKQIQEQTKTGVMTVLEMLKQCYAGFANLCDSAPTNCCATPVL